jgi:hypothetical protein
MLAVQSQYFLWWKMVAVNIGDMNMFFVVKSRLLLNGQEPADFVDRLCLEHHVLPQTTAMECS